MRTKNSLKKYFITALLICTALLSTILAACSSGGTNTSSANDTTPQRGGTIKVATIGDPPTLDMSATTATITQEITTNIYEGLFTLDSHFAPQPSLAQSYQVEDQGLRWVITLRKGVLFHNGQGMTTDDVLASLNRWGKISQFGHTLFADLANLVAPDKYTITIQLKKPMPIVPILLAVPEQQAAIYPKSVIDATGDGPLKQYIGTGPYKFVSWQPNQYIELARFDQYQARAEPTDGMAGKREAYADKIHFIPVPEVQQRVQGVQTGLYDFAENISPDLYANIKSAPSSMEPVIVKPYAFPVVVFNKKQGIFADLKMRQAVQAATVFQPMLQAAFGDPSFYRIDPSLFFRETKWWSDAGKDLYNQNNPDKAKQLLQEAGYQGQTVRVMTTQQYDWMYKLAVVLKSQLEAIGMHVTLDVVDWATLTQRRNNPSTYDIFTTGFNLILDPATSPFWDASWPGWWVNSQKDALLKQLATEADYNKRMALESQFQQLWYEDVPMLKVGDYYLLDVKSKKAHGAGLNSPILYLFNCWLSH